MSTATGPKNWQGNGDDDPTPFRSRGAKKPKKQAPPPPECNPTSHQDAVHHPPARDKVGVVPARKKTIQYKGRERPVSKYTLKKHDEEVTNGFAVRRNHSIKVFDGQAASRAGAKSGDFIIEINGKKIEDISDRDLQQMQKECTEMELITVSLEEMEFCKTNDGPSKSDIVYAEIRRDGSPPPKPPRRDDQKPSKQRSHGSQKQKPPPRPEQPKPIIYIVCLHVWSQFTECPFGVKLGFDKDKKEWKISQVVPDSPADHCGLKPGDYVIEINDQPLTHIKKQDLIDKLLEVKKVSDQISLTVVNPFTYQYFKDNGKVISPGDDELQRYIQNRESPASDPKAKPVLLPNFKIKDKHLEKKGIKREDIGQPQHFEHKGHAGVGGSWQKELKKHGT